MFSFQQPEYLYLLLALPLTVLLYLHILQWKKKTSTRIGDERLVKMMMQNYSAKKFALKFLLFSLSAGFAILALADPRSDKGTQAVKRTGIDVMIALDVSKSMLASDVKPNRLDRAKQALSKLIERLPNDRTGIVVFAGRAYLQMPLTGDHSAAKMFLSSAAPDMVPTQGTVIADALNMCYSAFNSQEKKYKAVVLISDGEDHDEGALKTAAKMAADGIVIYTVGIGSPQGAEIIDENGGVKKDENGNVIITRLNETELKNIAEKGNGSYMLFSNTDAMVTSLQGQLQNMDKRTISDDSMKSFTYYYSYFLAISLILLLIEFFMSERKKEEQKVMQLSKPVFILLVFFSIGPQLLFAQGDKSFIKKGNEAYEKQEYGKAVDLYQKAKEQDRANTTANYNLANALYKDKKADDAMQGYNEVIEHAASTELKANAFYNKGVALQNNSKLPECIEAYKNALKLNPADEDARQNLQKALKQQKKQEKEKEDKKNKPKEDQDKKNQEKPKDNEKKDEPKPKPSRMSKQDAEEKLKALLQQEKNLQDKLRRVGEASGAKPEKDW